MLRCTACGSSICGRECAEKRWKQHRPECRRLQAVAFGEEYAREQDRSYRMINAAYDGDTMTVKRLQIELSVAVAGTKFAKAADAAMRTFLDFIDPRKECTAAYVAVQENHPKIIRLLHQLRADLNKPTRKTGSAPAVIAAQQGHEAMVRLLYDLGADIHRAAYRNARPIHSAAAMGNDKTVLILLLLRADVNVQDNVGCTPCWVAAAEGHTSVVSLLLDAKADPNLAVENYTTADMAHYQNHASTLELLLARGGRQDQTG